VATIHIELRSSTGFWGCCITFADIRYLNFDRCPKLTLNMNSGQNPTSKHFHVSE